MAAALGNDRHDVVFPQNPAGRKPARAHRKLDRGEFDVRGSIKLSASGVVLRGSGAGNGGTVIRATGSDRRPLIVIEGEGSPRLAEPRVPIRQVSVPLGATQMQMGAAHPFRAGDSIVVTRPSTEPWIQALKADTFGIQWRPGSRDVQWHRVVTKVLGETIELNAPLTMALETRFGGGTVQAYTWPERIEHLGVEDLALVSGGNEADWDEDHARLGVTIDKAANAWVRCVSVQPLVLEPHQTVCPPLRCTRLGTFPPSLLSAQRARGRRALGRFPLASCQQRERNRAA